MQGGHIAGPVAKEGKRRWSGWSGPVRLFPSPFTPTGLRIDDFGQKMVFENMQTLPGRAFPGDAGFDQLHHPVNVVGPDPQIFLERPADAFGPRLGAEEAGFEGKSFGSSPFLFTFSMM